jgi:proteasome lid subunit RPN8/RPN11
MRAGKLEALAAQGETLKFYRLTHTEFRRLHLRAYRAQQRDHYEVGGFLFVRAARPRDLCLHFMINRAQVPYQFRVHDREATVAARALRREGKRILGQFHSHPVGYATLLGKDRRRATRRFELIYDVCGRQARMWRIQMRGGRRRVVEVPLVVEKSRQVDKGAS